MNRRWISRFDNGDVFIVFIHGILSSAQAAWTNRRGVSWPEIACRSFPTVSVCEVSYKTDLFSASYSISDVADALFERLKQDGVIANGKKVVFVCHSMGGVVVRRMLLKGQDEFVNKRISTGLLLVASPSIGSRYAKWLLSVSRFFGHSQAEALRMSENNQWLLDLDSDFSNLLGQKKLEIVGREVVEDKMIGLRFLWFLPRIVPVISGARYFPRRLKIPGADHFSIAAPDSWDSLQHVVLCELVRQVFDISAENLSGLGGVKSLEQKKFFPRIMIGIVVSALVFFLIAIFSQKSVKESVVARVEMRPNFSVLRLVNNPRSVDDGFKTILENERGKQFSIYYDKPVIKILVVSYIKSDCMDYVKALGVVKSSLDEYLSIQVYVLSIDENESSSQRNDFLKMNNLNVHMLGGDHDKVERLAESVRLVYFTDNGYPYDHSLSATVIVNNKLAGVVHPSDSLDVSGLVGDFLDYADYIEPRPSSSLWASYRERFFRSIDGASAYRKSIGSPSVYVKEKENLLETRALAAAEDQKNRLRILGCERDKRKDRGSNISMMKDWDTPDVSPPFIRRETGSGSFICGDRDTHNWGCTHRCTLLSAAL